MRITHKPSGIVVSMQDEKSQRQNREKAMRVLRARLLEHQLAEQQAEVAAERKAQVGSGERSEKIRTYNFPQDRITDHRVKLTANGIERVLGGELDEFTEALRRGEAAAARGPGGRGLMQGGQTGGASVREALAGAVDALAAAGVESPQLDAELLLAEATGWSRERFATDPGDALPSAAARAFGQMVRRRLRREPVAYILGRKGFRGIELEVTSRVLIPRPETELLVEVALELAPATVLDVGTGSGAVALAVADELPAHEVTATDTSADALRVAQANAARLGLERVKFATGTLPARGSFDLVLANLPTWARRSGSSLSPRSASTSRARRWSPAPRAWRRSSP